MRLPPPGLYGAVDITTIAVMVGFVGCVAWYSYRLSARGVALHNWPPRLLIWVAALEMLLDTARGVLYTVLGRPALLDYVVAAAWGCCAVILAVSRRVVRAQHMKRAEKVIQALTPTQLPPSLAQRMANRRSPR